MFWRRNGKYLFDKPIEHDLFWSDMVQVEGLWQLTAQSYLMILIEKFKQIYQHKICNLMPVMIIFP